MLRFVKQAALEHLESIMYNPFEKTSEEPSNEVPKTNGRLEEHKEDEDKQG